jgi:UDP-N-acetylglucosamine--N-acetylmuramyl-(pentapeptide) pyrophosphoryl-undecaprenol N-acetylglucosamine transferase
LHGPHAVVTGTPVRPEFKPREPGACRGALGLEPARPVVLVMGGSQGARGINEMVTRALPLLAQAVPSWQWFHLTGNDDVEVVKRAYAELKLTALVYPFFAGMDSALGAATVALSRAGASSLAELAAMRLPAVLVPYPSATDNHQFHNARAFVETGAARLLEQANAAPEALADLLRELVENAPMREIMQQALARWHEPRAAEQIAIRILESIGVKVLDEESDHKASQTVDPDRLAQSVLECGQSTAALIRTPTLRRCEASGSSLLAFQKRQRTARTPKRLAPLSAGQGELPL